MLLQGNRLESLCGLMTTWMKRHPLHPLENEVVLVQSNGIGQWLKLALAANPRDALSGGCGIAAAVEVTLPARFIWRVYRSVLEVLPDGSAFDKAPMSWRLYRLLGDLDALLDGDSDAQSGAPRTDPDCFAPLRRFLTTDADARRRWQLAERLADLYDQYQVYRADWLDAWQAGDDSLIRPDGSRQPVPGEQRWQPALWRCLKRDTQVQSGAKAVGERDDADRDSAPAEASRADIHQQFLHKARALTPDQRPEELPRRVVVFGISSLPRQALEVLDAIAHLSQVMLFVHNPSQHYWGDIVEGRELFRRAYGRTPARKVPEGLDETALHLHGHPLLAAWGKQGRDYIRLLDEHDQRERYEEHFHAQDLSIDLFESPGSDSLLRQLQDDILELRPMHERRALAAAIDPALDRSLGFLIAHSPQREVEILHDQLLDAFEQATADGAPLHPRDVLVMVPDIDVYAPHIAAVFGRLAPTDTRFIPFHLSDQGQRHRNPLLIGLETLLQLPRSRFAVSELLDLLDIAALRRRFGIDETDLPRLRLWISGANIRWGLDAGQRAELGLPDGLEQNTWRFGVRRMLLGFAAGASGPWRGVEPFDEIGGLEAALIGPLVQLLDMLERYWHALQGERDAAQWTGLVAGLLDDAFAPVSEADNLGISLVQDALEHWAQDCRRGGAGDEMLPLEVVREPLLAALDEPSLSQRFLAGAVNFATLMPMRAVPFRQIWLLGMNDGDYPRSRQPLDFDLMARDYRPGDRSRREDDRYLFLEALLSARDRLVISWVGRSIRDNSVRPPSVLVGQLRDHLSAGWRLAGQSSAIGAKRSGQALVDALTTEHPLQPFGRRYFAPDRDPRLFTYASEWRSAHQRGERETAVEPPPRLGRPALDGEITLTALARFLRHPVRHFYSRRLGLLLTGDVDGVDDEEVFEFDGLGNWAMQDDAIHAVLERLVQRSDSTVDTRTCLRDATAQLARAGRLPLPPFDQRWTEALIENLATPLDAYRTLLLAYPQTCLARVVDLDGDGIKLQDTLSHLRTDADGNRLNLVLQASRLNSGDDLKWYHLVRLWPRHLAAQLHGATTTRVLGPDTDFTLLPLAADRAEATLHQLLAGYLEGSTDLLPLACKTAFARLGAEDERKANPESVYEGGYNRAGEGDEHPGYRRFWPSYAALRDDPRSRRLIHQLYRPLYRHARTSG